jgi:hypothetical protein
VAGTVPPTPPSTGGATNGATAIVFSARTGARSSPSRIESASTATVTVPARSAVSSRVAGSSTATLPARRASSTLPPIASPSPPDQRTDIG